LISGSTRLRLLALIVVVLPATIKSPSILNVVVTLWCVVFAAPHKRVPLAAGRVSVRLNAPIALAC
jgi:hypothetical protein